MATPDQFSTISDLLGIEDERVDYGSDTESKASTLMCDERPRQAPNLFYESGAADALTALHMTPGMGSSIIMNPLDEEQDQVLQQRENAQRKFFLDHGDTLKS